MKREIREVLDNLRRDGIIGMAVVDKEGEIIASKLPGQVHEETFGIMSATVIGASSSANSELDRGSIEIAILHSDEGKIVLANTKVELILGLVTEESFDVQSMFDDIHDAVERLNVLF